MCFIFLKMIVFFNQNLKMVFINNATWFRRQFFKIKTSKKMKNKLQYNYK